MWAGSTVDGDYLAALRGSQVVTCRMDVYTGSVRTNPPAYPDGIPVTPSSALTIDSTSRVRRQLAVTVAAPDLAPDEAGDILAQAGVEFYLNHGLMLPGGQLRWVPLGLFHLDSTVDIITAPTGTQAVLVDRGAYVTDETFWRPEQSAVGASCVTEIARLALHAVPALGINRTVLDLTGSRIPAPRVVWTDPDRWAAIGSLEAAAGVTVYFGPDGRLNIRPVATLSDAPAWRLDGGRGGVLSTATRRAGRAQGGYNGVAVISERSDAASVAALVVDEDNTSPTWWGTDGAPGGYGHKIKTYRTSLVSTVAQARAMAARLLGPVKGWNRSYSLTAVPCWPLDADDVIHLAPDGGQAEPHIVDKVTLSLGTAAMGLETRSTSAPGIVPVQTVPTVPPDPGGGGTGGGGGTTNPDGSTWGRGLWGRGTWGGGSTVAPAAKVEIIVTYTSGQPRYPGDTFTRDQMGANLAASSNGGNQHAQNFGGNVGDGGGGGTSLATINWSVMDSRIANMGEQSSSRKYITLFAFPTWITGAAAYSDAPPLESKRADLAAWAKAVVARYLPQGVTHYQFGNELKGYYDGGGQEDFARYIRDYNAIWDAIKGDPATAAAKIGGPYCVGVYHQSQDWGGECNGPWGSIKPAITDGLRLFKATARGADFIALDYTSQDHTIYEGGTSDNPLNLPWSTRQLYYRDFTQFARTLFGPTMPIVASEFYWGSPDMFEAALDQFRAGGGNTIMIWNEYDTVAARIVDRDTGALTPFGTVLVNLRAAGKTRGPADY